MKRSSSCEQNPGRDLVSSPLAKKTEFQRAIVDWFDREGRDYPWRRTRDPYAILVSEMMLQQTQVATVLERRYFERWLEQFPDVATLACASEEKVLRAWEGLGYYQRARNLQLAAQVIVRDFEGVFPRSPAELRKLPGLGAYTAGAVATFAMDLPEPIVDANIARVLARLFCWEHEVDSEPGKSQIWQWASELVPQQNACRYNSGIMELGQRICVPRAPNCGGCPVQSFCVGKSRQPERLPLKRPKRRTVHLTEHAILAICDGRILLRQEQGRRREGLWRLPERDFSHVTGRLSPLLLSLTYTITHHRVNLCVYEDTKVEAEPGESWQEVKELGKLPMPSPYRKALAKIRERHQIAGLG